MVFQMGTLSWVCVTTEGVLDRRLVITTNNYSTITNFHTLQITIAHAKSFLSAVPSPVIPW
jgi:hypothetical protein